MLHLLFTFLTLSLATPAVPVWPKQFTASGLFSIPYGYGINEPILNAYDAVNNRAKLSYYHGMDEYFYRYDQQKTYMIVPRVDTKTCFANPGDASQQPLPSILPDLTGWAWVGDNNGIRTWQKNVTSLGRLNTHTMQVRATDNTPVQLTMEGYDFLFGSHPDVYVLKYHSFQASVKPEQFTVPKLCSSAEPNLRAGARGEALANILTSALGTEEPANAFDAYLFKHRKTYDSVEYDRRYSAWRENTKLIQSHNAAGDKQYSLKMNHFGDWTHDEFRYFMLPKSLSNTKKPHFEATYVHPEPTAEQLAALPASIDWRTKGAVTMVKDQGVCGSCWTFGTTGSLEGVWAAKYGNLVSLSEQQIVDCAWGNGTDGQGDSGCDGGFAGPALQWIMDNGGIALQGDYPYLMVDGWCNAAVRSSGVKVRGYANVTMGSETALQVAVATYGPVSVAIDAAHEHFEYYANGVYYNPNCKNGLDDLDHEVLVVGYGTENGQDYWIVKNSWSTHWGDNGYIKMARNKNNNCGIATQANFPLV